MFFNNLLIFSVITNEGFPNLLLTIDISLKLRLSLKPVPIDF